MAQQIHSLLSWSAEASGLVRKQASGTASIVRVRRKLTTARSFRRNVKQQIGRQITPSPETGASVHLVKQNIQVIMGQLPTTTSLPTKRAIMIDDIRFTSHSHLEHIVEVKHVPPAKLFLRFADGFQGTWSLETLGLSLLTVKPTTATISHGNAIKMKSVNGAVVSIDTSSLRYCVDNTYAANMDAEVASLLIPSERLERIAANNQPPQAWYDSVEDDD